MTQNDVDAPEVAEAAEPTKAKAKPKKEPVPKDTVNGVTRPKSGTKTGRVWEIADAQSKQKGEPAPRKAVIDEAMTDDINAATAATQYGRWRKYHGLKAEPKAPKAPKAETEAMAEAGEAGVE